MKTTGAQCCELKFDGCLEESCLLAHGFEQVLFTTSGHEGFKFSTQQQKRQFRESTCEGHGPQLRAWLQTS